jgi:hypothetical protein
MVEAVQEVLPGKRRQWRWLRSDLPTRTCLRRHRLCIAAPTHLHQQRPAPTRLRQHRPAAAAVVHRAARAIERAAEGKVPPQGFSGMGSMTVGARRPPGIVAVVRGLGDTGIQIELAVRTCEVGRLTAELQ